ncbi:hypothetical protein GWI33_023093 [Rhynchophorus ferrugineus]|uniref:Uncharacterized protein n=1 Tax=Rhynchophorus ferrugineus TaxID=354439 RepID=A0A834IZW9_RHYFE|nr:hypothetical protein GWI33_023093 [Rhynchophorus ferrugineus]
MHIEANLDSLEPVDIFHINARVYKSVVEDFKCSNLDYIRLRNFERNVSYGGIPLTDQNIVAVLNHTIDQIIAIRHNRNSEIHIGPVFSENKVPKNSDQVLEKVESTCNNIVSTKSNDALTLLLFGIDELVF